MKKNICVIAGLLILMVMACNKSDDASSNGLAKFEEDVLDLQSSLELIEALAGESVCGDGFECRSIALGEKACGGPKSYIIYSTSIDTEQLEALVAAHNLKEKEFNVTWDVASDCLFVLPPSTIGCEDGKCVVVNGN